MTKKYRSDAFAAIHEAMEALHEVGTIDKQTMRQFDEACLTLRKPRNNRGDRSLLTHPATGLSRNSFLVHLKSMTCKDIKNQEIALNSSCFLVTPCPDKGLTLLRTNG